MQVVRGRILHTQRAAAHQVDVVGVVGVEVGHDVRPLRHVEGHVHLESVQHRALDDDLCGVAEVGELDQLLQLVVGGQRRVAQHVAHVRRAQHFQPAAHGEVVDGSAHGGEDVDEGLAVGDALGILLGTDNLEVLCPHAHVERHVVGPAEVEVALDVQRLVVVGVDGEVLEQQLGVHDAHGVVVEPERHAVGDALHVGRVEVDFAVHLGFRQFSLDGQLALAVAVQPEQLVGNESVEYRQRRALHEEPRVERSLTFIIIGAGQQADLMAVLHQPGLHGVGVVLLLQVDQLGAQVAYRTALVGQLVHVHVADHRDVSSGVLHHVEVAVQQSGHARQRVGQHGADLAQIEAVQADGDVLQGRRV